MTANLTQSSNLSNLYSNLSIPVHGPLDLIFFVLLTENGQVVIILRLGASHSSNHIHLQGLKSVLILSMGFSQSLLITFINRTNRLIEM